MIQDKYTELDVAAKGVKGRVGFQNMVPYIYVKTEEDIPAVISIVTGFTVLNVDRADNGYYIRFATCQK